MKRIKKPPHISQKDWDDVDVPELSDEDFKRARPASEAVPDIVAAYKAGTLRKRGQRGTQKKPKKIAVHARFSPEVVAFFKARGPGWQTRMDKALLAFVEAAR